MDISFFLYFCEIKFYNIMNILDKICTLELSKRLKDIGYNIPVEHCFIHDTNEKYDFIFYPYVFYNFGEIGKIFSHLHEKNQFNNNVNFNFNQDFKKLMFEFYDGIKFTDGEPKDFIDSYSFEKNINIYENFIIYPDIVSAPYLNDVLDWFRETWNFDFTIKKSTKDSFKYEIERRFCENTYFYTDFYFETYEIAQINLIKKILKLIEDKQIWKILNE